MVMPQPISSKVDHATADVIVEITKVASESIHQLVCDTSTKSQVIAHESWLFTKLKKLQSNVWEEGDSVVAVYTAETKCQSEPLEHVYVSTPHLIAYNGCVSSNAGDNQR